ncbi:MAG TPA: LytTR family DNA-binding domain-containing protein [Acidobacteriaceae bacterium]|jgi:two-component system LytT family response regulator|nr:LytTR family DNA-binding domain-containing protein [Acidobacteriaceae bacterium]
MIVDDEPLARRGVALRLRKFRNVEIIGECGDGSSAVEKILELAPDIVFLDVEMPEMNGFDVLRALPRENLPGVIFLTAYEKHAVQAFEVHALDYLLKPVDDVRFAAAICRAQKTVDSALKSTMAARVLGMLDRTLEKWASRFAVQTGSRIQIVLAEDVEWIGAAGDYAELHVSGRCYLLRETMTSLEQRLDPSKFLRIHRSRIVQTESILELSSIENREFNVRLSDGSQHRSSRTYAVNLEHWLSSNRP